MCNFVRGHLCSWDNYEPWCQMLISTSLSYYWKNPERSYETQTCLFYYSADRSDEMASLGSRINILQQEITTKRSQVDTLSNQMAILSRHLNTLKAGGSDMTSSMKIHTQTISVLKQLPWTHLFALCTCFQRIQVTSFWRSCVFFWKSNYLVPNLTHIWLIWFGICGLISP